MQAAPFSGATPEPKPRLVALAEHHLEQDIVVQGLHAFTSDDGRGCSLGCLVRDIVGGRPDDIDFFKMAAEHMYCGHEWAARLHERLYETLPADHAKRLHVDTMRARFAGGEGVTPDMQRVYHRTMIGVLDVALPHDKSEPSVVHCVIALHKRALQGDAPSESEWNAAWDAAWDAASAAALVKIADAFIEALRVEAFAAAGQQVAS